MTPSPGARRSVRRQRTAAALIATGTTVLAATMAGMGPQADASSHREAPLISGLPQLDNTDVYAFTSPDNPDTVTMIADWIPFEEPNGGPNFYPWAEGAHYDLNIDSNGDGRPDTTYRWQFHNVDHRDGKTFLYNNGVVRDLNDPTLLFKQNYTLTEIKGNGERTLINDGVSAPSDVGPTSMPDYGRLRAQAIHGLPGGGKTFAGQADDPFFLDLRVFDLLYGAPKLNEVGQDTLRGYNVNTIAIQVPKKDLALRNDPAGNPVIGVWSSTEQRSLTLRPSGGADLTGRYVQVSRLGNPLVNEVISAAGQKDGFNASSPVQDHTNKAFLDRVTNPEVPQDVELLYGIKAPPAPRNDLVEIFATGVYKNSAGPIKADLNSQLLNKDVNPKAFVPAEEERLNMSTPITREPNRLGVLGGDLQGFPNGRRLADDAVDIELQTLEGAFNQGLPPHIVPALAKGDGVDHNDLRFSDQFPYVALPHDQGVNTAGSGDDGDQRGDKGDHKGDKGDHRGDGPFGSNHDGDKHRDGGFLGLGNLLGFGSPTAVGGLFGMMMIGSGSSLLRRRGSDKVRGD
ncbi:MAG: hypothetical protein DLM62_16140 [Pseudonocardiales bacterium]|nr:MAG: hypothetical protein DLM62_16140 [Pseudonocardiales bacterium]